MNFEILKPNENEILDAHALEVEYSDLSRYGTDDGFFIKTEKISLYHDLNELECVWVAKVDNIVIGQYVIIPAGHDIMHRLFNSGCMDFFDNLSLTASNSYWLAKIAVKPEFKRSGAGGKLIQHMINNNPMLNLLTTTALTPMTNKAIAGLVQKSGFKKVGVWVSGQEKELTCNYLWLFPRSN